MEKSNDALASTNEALMKAKEELGRVEGLSEELEKAKDTLASTNEELVKAKEELGRVEVLSEELEKSKDALACTNEALMKAKEELGRVEVLSEELEKSKDALASTNEELVKAKEELHMAREKLLEYQDTISRQEHRLECQAKGSGQDTRKDKGEANMVQVTISPTNNQEVASLRGALDRANNEVNQLQAQLYALRNNSVTHSAVTHPLDRPITPGNIDVATSTAASTAASASIAPTAATPIITTTATEAITAQLTAAPPTATTTTAEMKRLSSVMHQLERENATLSRMLAARGRQERDCSHPLIYPLVYPLIHLLISPHVPSNPPSNTLSCTGRELRNVTSFVSITQPTLDNDDGDCDENDDDGAVSSSNAIALIRPTAGSLGGVNVGEHVTVGEHYHGTYPLDPAPLTDLSMVPIGEGTRVCQSLQCPYRTETHS